MQFHFSMGWDVQTEVCDRFRRSREIKHTHEKEQSLDEQLSARSENFSDLSWLNYIVHHHLDNQALIEAVPKKELVSIFFLRNRGLIDSLSPAPKRCLALLKAELPPFFQQYAR